MSCCSSCGSSSACSCNCIPATPTPPCSAGVGCEQVHTQLIVQNRYATGIATSHSFNMPACGEFTTVTFPGLQIIPVGAYLWSPLFGYLKVTAFDIASATVTVQNECQDGNAAVGTQVPSCTLFTISTNPIGVDNPCTNAVVAQGALVVCHNGVMQPLDAVAAGQVPVSLDAGTNEVEFRTIDVPTLICTDLRTALTLIPANLGPYVFDVNSTSGFLPGDIIQLATTLHRFIINTITPPNTITATMISSSVVGLETYAIGTQVCLSSCCEQLENLIETNTTAIQGALQVITDASATSIAAPEVLVDTIPFKPVADNLVITNISTASMSCIIDVTAVFTALLTNNGASPIDMQLVYYGFADSVLEPVGTPTTIPAVTPWRTLTEDYIILPGPPPPPGGGAPGAMNVNKEMSIHYRFIIPPNTQLRFAATGGIQAYIAAGDDVTLSRLDVLMNGLGVAV